jgi:hypothetical protein
MKCAICGKSAIRQIVTRGLAAIGQTAYCDSHAAELLSRAVRPRLRPEPHDSESDR